MAFPTLSSRMRPAPWGNEAQSPAAQICGSDVRPCASVSIPFVMARPAASASPVLGVMPTPTTIVYLPAPPPQETIYTVVAGDSLWKIAAKFYGKGHLFKKIIEANPDKLVDENTVIHPGDQLKIPPVD